MSLRNRALALSATLASLSTLAPVTAHGQSTVATNTLMASSYVFRGVTLTNVPTAQPKLAISAPSAGGTVSAWVAGNVEFAIPSGANTLSEGGGVAGVNEIDLVAQYAHKAGPALLSVGATRYEYSGHNRVLTTSYNTTEIFLGSRLDNVWGTPSITANWDVQTIHGVYVEAAAAHSVPLGRFAPVVGIVAGYTAGQEARGATDQYYSFTQKGLTHVDISASTTIAVAAMAIAPAVHLQLSPSGQNTRAVGALARNADRGAKLWFGFDLGWAHAFDKR